MGKETLSGEGNLSILIYERNPEKFLSLDETHDDPPAKKKTEPRKQPEKKPSKDVSPKGKDKPLADGGFERINGLKCVRVKQGDTFYGLSKRAGSRWTS